VEKGSVRLNGYASAQYRPSKLLNQPGACVGFTTGAAVVFADSVDRPVFSILIGGCVTKRLRLLWRLRDVTKQKRAKNFLKQSAPQFRTPGGKQDERISGTR
jgi:hypothetical protein